MVVMATTLSLKESSGKRNRGKLNAEENGGRGKGYSMEFSAFIHLLQSLPFWLNKYI